MKINFKYNRKNFIIATVISLLNLIVLILGAATSIKFLNAFAALIVLQFGIAFLWVMVKLGTFKGSFSSTRKITDIRRQKFIEKYDLKKQNNNDKNSKTENDSENYFGITLMLVIGLLEIIAYLIYINI